MLLLKKCEDQSFTSTYIPYLYNTFIFGSSRRMMKGEGKLGERHVRIDADTLQS